jgi:hypothetical protein
MSRRPSSGQQRGSNLAGRAHTNHHDTNGLVLQYRQVARGLVVGAALGVSRWHARGQGSNPLSSTLWT